MKKLHNLAIVIASCMFLLVSDFVYAKMAVSSDDPLVMGIFPRRNATVSVKLFKPMAKYLSEQLGRPVKLVTTKDFKSFWKGVTEKKYDIVHFNQYHYILSHEKYGYNVILKNSEFGESTIAGSIIVKKDSGIETAADLKGKTIVFGGGPKAAQSYIVATYLLQQAGLTEKDYTKKFAKNPPNAIFSTYYGQSAAAGSGDKVLRLGVVQKKIKADDMKILLHGEQLPHLPWAIKANLGEELINKIQSVLTSLSGTDKGKAILKKAKLSGLVVATDGEYDKHRKIVKAVYPDK